ncbi:hypothetical protein T260_08045 [Geobacillus thermopakistaniensis]|uniref:Uncharacterized protein n=1 Tax=Geobacillus thermopakistaniensis (strain MAS1) TaxID=1408282 RepID=A0A7U9JBF6_GEOTM|nr:hypothetical protein T260_08045 [Geobacillus sp. MAS1]
MSGQLALAVFTKIIKMRPERMPGFFNLVGRARVISIKSAAKVHSSA